MNPKFTPQQSNTLTRLADEVAAGTALSVASGNFLDAFYRHPDAGLLTDEPALLIESPPAFRARNIFITANALDRASRRHVA